jgi:hypothetical protein
MKRAQEYIMSHNRTRYYIFLKLSIYLYINKLVISTYEKFISVVSFIVTGFTFGMISLMLTLSRRNTWYCIKLIILSHMICIIW